MGELGRTLDSRVLASGHTRHRYPQVLEETHRHAQVGLDNSLQVHVRSGCHTTSEGLHPFTSISSLRCSGSMGTIRALPMQVTSQCSIKYNINMQLWEEIFYKYQKLTKYPERNFPDSSREVCQAGQSALYTGVRTFKYLRGAENTLTILHTYIGPLGHSG